MKRVYYFFLLAVVFVSCNPAPESIIKTRDSLELAQGWNSWNYRSITEYVLLPESFSVKLGFKEFAYGQVIDEVLWGYDMQDVTLGLRALDGSYASFVLQWEGRRIQVESATEGEDLVIRVRLCDSLIIPKIAVIVDCGFLWNQAGSTKKEKGMLLGKTDRKSIPVFITGNEIDEVYAGLRNNPYLVIELDKEVTISTNRRRDIESIVSLIDDKKERLIKEQESYGANSKSIDAIRSALGWNTVYEPVSGRVITPVSRRWSYYNGGFVLYCWDTYFAALMASVLSKDLAWSNFYAITGAITGKGFVPNTYKPNGLITLDRSQPPLGSFAAYTIYKNHRDTIPLRKVYPSLLKWNRWWYTSRNYKGLLCWGSDYYEPWSGNAWETSGKGVNDSYGAALESGWDNSVLYNDVPFDKQKSISTEWDVGLNSLYILDCNMLSRIAGILGEKKDSIELSGNSKTFFQNMDTLWDPQSCIYKNKSWKTGKFNSVVTASSFYPLMVGVPTSERVKIMLEKYLLNPEEFYGSYMIPVLSRNHPLFHSQDYWNGRIWPPVNFLVYCGLRNYPFSEVRKAIVTKSTDLFFQSFDSYRHIRENYLATNGWGDDRNGSDEFYHWGALLALIPLIEDNHFHFPDATEMVPYPENLKLNVIE